MNYAVVTGVSRGLGKACARMFLECGVHVIGISRSICPDLERSARENNATFNHFCCDLSVLPDVEKTCAEIAELIFGDEDISSLYVINNAAVVIPIDLADKLTDAEILDRHMRINLVSPMAILNTFLQKASDQDVPLIGVNITARAAAQPMMGFAAYCSSKAGLDMYTKTVAKELEEMGSFHKVIGFDPGAMDTGLQKEIRQSSVGTELTEVERSRRFKLDNLLSPTDEIGGILVDILTDAPNVMNGKIYSVEDYL